MSKIIAYCGLNCSECPAYIATQTNNQELLKSTAKEWSSEEMSFKPEELLCDGCKAAEQVFSWCESCDIRICAKDKNLINCAYCEEYPCEKLEMCHQKSPDAKNTLDSIKTTL